MANKKYPKWNEARLQSTANAALDGTGATGVYAALIDTAVYTYDDAHEFWDAGGAGDPIDAIVGTAVELTGKTYTGGVFDALDSLFTSVTGPTVEAVILFVKNAGAATTWRLLAYIDNAVGLPATPDGTDIPVLWNNDANKIFKL